MKPISAQYFSFNEKESINIKYGECVEAAQLRGEVILGVQLHSEQKSSKKMFGIKLIPDKNKEFILCKNDGLIALAPDES